MTRLIQFYKEDYPVPNWDIAMQVVGFGYVPYSTEKNGHAGGLHAMDDFGNLVQTLPQNHHFEQERRYDAQYRDWGAFGVDDSYFVH